MATRGNGPFNMERKRGGLYPAVENNRLRKKKKKKVSTCIQVGKSTDSALHGFIGV